MKMGYSFSALEILYKYDCINLEEQRTYFSKKCLGGNNLRNFLSAKYKGNNTLCIFWHAN